MSSTGSTNHVETALRKMSDIAIFDVLSKYGQRGVDALSNATPFDSGITSESWFYEVKKDATSWSIIWGNTHVEDGRPIAILLQYGHGTGTGGWVNGRDYINPSIKPIFDEIKTEVGRVVRSL